MTPVKARKIYPILVEKYLSKSIQVQIEFSPRGVLAGKLTQTFYLAGPLLPLRFTKISHLNGKFYASLRHLNSFHFLVRYLTRKNRTF
jgi:hypothetical protein